MHIRSLPVCKCVNVCYIFFTFEFWQPGATYKHTHIYSIYTYTFHIYIHLTISTYTLPSAHTHRTHTHCARTHTRTNEAVHHNFRGFCEVNCQVRECILGGWSSEHERYEYPSDSLFLSIIAPSPTNRPTNQLTNKLTNQPTDQPTNQSTIDQPTS